MNETSLQSAVRNEKLITKQGFLQKLFTIWFDAFVYNQIWEDPRVDIEALEIDGDSRILTISSGGCNALNYLIEGPQSVTAVDLNRHHIHLLNLKLAALKYLPCYEDLFEFFGEGGGPRTGSNYIRYIRLNLDKATRDFWESNSLFGSLVYGDRISFFRDGGLYDHSRNGYFLKFFQWFARLSGCKTKTVLSARDVEHQKELYREHIDPFFDSRLIRFIGKLPVTMFGLGIPPQQYDELKKETGGDKTLIDLYRERVRRLACDFPIAENYFAWQAFARMYDCENRKALPEYLKEENFAKLRSNAERLSTKIGSVTDEILNRDPLVFNRFVLLDAQDWMTQEQITELWSAIAEKAPAGSRIIFRTAGAASPLSAILPANLLSMFHYEREISARLFRRDRASIYGGFHLYVKR